MRLLTHSRYSGRTSLEKRVDLRTSEAAPNRNDALLVIAAVCEQGISHRVDHGAGRRFFQRSQNVPGIRRPSINHVRREISKLRVLIDRMAALRGDLRPADWRQITRYERVPMRTPAPGSCATMTSAPAKKC